MLTGNTPSAQKVDSKTSSLNQDISIVMTFIRSIENCRSPEEYRLGRSVRFPRNVQLALVLGEMEPNLVKRHLQLIDRTDPRKFLGQVVDTSNPTTSDPNYHLLVLHAPVLISLLQKALFRDNDPPTVMSTLTSAVARYGIAPVERWSNKVMCQGASLNEFWRSIGRIIDGGVAVNCKLADVARMVLALYRACSYHLVNRAIQEPELLEKLARCSIGPVDKSSIAILVSAVKRFAKVGLSPLTYFELRLHFLKMENASPDLEKKLLLACSKLNRTTCDLYLRYLIAPQSDRCLIQLLGFDQALSLVAIAGKMNVPPVCLKALVTPYGGIDLSPLDLILEQQLKSREPFEHRFLDLFKLANLGHSDVLLYLLSSKGGDLLKSRAAAEMLKLGEAIKKLKISFTELVNIPFYQKALVKSFAESLHFLEELSTDRFSNLDAKALLLTQIPSSQEFILEIGISQFTENLKFCLEERIEIEIIFTQCLPVLKDCIVLDLRLAKNLNERAKLERAIVTLENLKGVVSEPEREKLVNELALKVKEKATLGTHKINFYLHEIQSLSHNVLGAGLELKEVLEKIRAKKPSNLSRFIEASRTVLKESEPAK